MKKFVLSLTVLSALFVSCSDDDTELDDTQVEIEEEVITNVDVILTPVEGGGAPVVLSFVDADGIGVGEEAEMVASSTLAANTEYMGSFSITNTLADEEEEMDVTAEIAELAEEHQFFFESQTDTIISYDDLDDNDYPVGLAFSLATAEAGSDVLRVVLRHEPNKGAEGVAEGFIENENEGSSDFDIDFPIVIEEVAL